MREWRFNPGVHRAKGDRLVRGALPVGGNDMEDFQSILYSNKENKHSLHVGAL